MVERSPEEAGVVSSILTPGTMAKVKNMNELQIHRFVRFGIIFISFGCFCVFVFGVLGIGNSIMTYPLKYSETPKKADVVIVLGSGLKKDGTLGKIAQSRVARGVELWKEGIAPLILMTGGPVHGDTTRIESKVMAAYAVTLGVPEESILTETNSTSTRENAEFSKLVMDVHQIQTADIVTSRFHSRRSCQVFHNEQINVTCIAVDNDQAGFTFGNRLNLAVSIFREYLATAYYSLKGYL